MNYLYPEMTQGHQFFTEATESELISVGTYRQTGRIVKMQKDAASALIHMMAEACLAGVSLVPISGFRSLVQQEALFRKAVIKHGSESAAARWVAPSGQSEHHTGLAVDLGEMGNQEADVEMIFAETRAFWWLETNAARHGFEMSFPRNNAQGINYEPWHWRFIGVPACRRVFENGTTN